jgi:NAD(P)-dependent dehydrogenase (short-subunit alcohol dehydrogenase family)
MSRMHSKVCLVTGAATGIGLATATLFAEQGAQVWLTDVNVALGEAAAAGLRDRGLRAHFTRHDVTSRDDWEVVFAEIKSHGFPPDVVVNNAGIVIPGSVESTDWKSWRKTLDINLDGVFHGVQLGVREMKAKGGSIVNLASIEGLLGEPMAFAYNASKGAVRLLTKSAALHCARSGINVRINSVCPGFVETSLVLDAVSSQPPEVAQAMFAKVIGRTPMGRMALPTEIALAILYLACDESSYVTGSDLLIDGGYTAG